MIKNQKSLFKPIYKKFIKLRINVQNRVKILRFQKLKWKQFQKNYKRQLKWYKKFKPQNQNLYLVSKYPNRYTGYKNNFKQTLIVYTAFKFFYGYRGKKQIKQLINKAKKKQLITLKTTLLTLFEKRLDVILYRSKFCYSIRNAQQCIINNRININGKKETNKNYILQTGDLISIDLKNLKLVKTQLFRATRWPIPPKHLLINYSTFQIILTNFEHSKSSILFSFNLQLEKLLLDFSHP